MVKVSFRYLLTNSLLLFFVISCKNKDSEVHSTLNYVQLETPSFFPELIQNPDNLLTEEGIELGRKLYNDPILSNNGMSCSSCHLQSSSFSLESVNSLAHINLGWHSSFLWNGKIEGTLEDVMLFEVEDFFGTNITLIQNDSYYKTAFKQVFKTDLITQKEIAYALAQFVRTMISSYSKLDKYLRHEVMLTEEEFIGLDIFMTEKGDCFHCHPLGLFTDNLFHNTGLDSEFEGVNQGRFTITGTTTDLGKFKTPTLRNVALTPPYMHDGRFETLDEVIEFYNSNVHASEYTDPIMTKPGKEFGLQLTTYEKECLKAFLRSLTDNDYIQNPKFAKP
jgi:cytochrome c peroxidase